MLSNFLLAHTEPVIQSTLPVYGTWQISLGLILASIVGVWIFYKIFDVLPRYTKLNDRREVFLIKLMMVSILGGLFAASWDVWWHRAIGRESLFTPPHIFLYSFATLSILIGLYIWRHTNEKIWKHIALVLLIVPITAPFDNLWHLFFGIEDLSRPISLSWSPPHAMLDIAVLVAFALILKALHKHHKVKDETFFGGIGFGAVFTCAMFLVMPFHPTEGWGQVAGFSGAGVLAATYLIVALSAQHWMKSSVSATWMSLFALMLMFTSYGEDTAASIIILPHDRQPLWIYVFAYLGTAGFLDWFKDKMPLYLRSSLAGGIWALVFFGLSSRFLQPEFQYSFDQVLIAAFAGLVGGLVVAVIYKFATRK